MRANNNGKTPSVPTKPQAQGLAVVDPAMLKALEADAGAGFEGTAAQDFAIPFLTLLQKLSPAVDESDAGYVPGAKPGMFYNATTGKLYDEVQLIPCHYRRAIVEWKPDRGGFVAQHDPISAPKEAGRNEKGVPLTAEGNLLVDTRYFGCMLLDPDNGPTKVIVALSSTGLKVAKNWLSRMEAIKFDGQHGKFTPPMFAHVWNVSAVDHENERGKWKGWKVDLAGRVEDMGVFAEAKDTRQVFSTTTITPPLLEAHEEVEGQGREGKM